MKNNEKENFNKKRPSIDGVSSNRASFNFASQSQNIGFAEKKQSNSARGSLDIHAGRRGTIGNFSKKEGFYSGSKNQLGAGVTTKTPPKKLNFEPVVIDNPKKPRRKILKFIPIGRDPNKGPLSRKQKIFRGMAAGMAVMLILGGVFGYSIIRKILSGGGGATALMQNVDPSKLRGEGDGRVNILLLGRGGEGHEAPDLTDTIIIASIDPIAKEAALVSIPRDLYVTVDSLTASMKINAVFSTGKSNAQVENPNISLKDAEDQGFKLLESTVESRLGLPIHYHAIIDFGGFEKAVDTVGGVTVNAPDRVYEEMRINGQQYILDVRPGVQQMDGFEALAYSRSRYTSTRGDFDRAVRQRLIITALKDKILTAETFGNPQKVISLLNNFGDHISTNFSIQDMMRLRELSQEITTDKISSVGLSDPPNNFITTSMIGDQSVVIPVAGIDDFSDIQYFLRNELKDSYLKDEDAKIAVFNGTFANGLATEKGTELKSYGYKVTKIGNAPTKNYPSTVLVDLRNGKNKYTKSYLEKRFNTTAVGALPDNEIAAGEADFVIILGNDQAN